MLWRVRAHVMILSKTHLGFPGASPCRLLGRRFPFTRPHTGPLGCPGKPNFRASWLLYRGPSSLWQSPLRAPAHGEVGWDPPALLTPVLQLEPAGHTHGAVHFGVLVLLLFLSLPSISRTQRDGLWHSSFSNLVVCL